MVSVGQTCQFVRNGDQHYLGHMLGLMSPASKEMRAGSGTTWLQGYIEIRIPAYSLPLRARALLLPFSLQIIKSLNKWLISVFALLSSRVNL